MVFRCRDKKSHKNNDQVGGRCRAEEDVSKRSEGGVTKIH